MRLLACFFLLVLSLAFAAGCGDDDSPASSPTVEASPRPGDDDDDEGSPTAVPTHELSAEGNKFDETTLTTEAGETIVLLFKNIDAGTHNFAVYTTTEAEEEIFVGETITEAGEQIVYEFEAPAPGEYFFRCDVHPVDMTGELIVR